MQRLMAWLKEPVTAQGRSRGWRICFWGVQLPLAGLMGCVIGAVIGALL